MRAGGERPAFAEYVAQTRFDVAVSLAAGLCRRGSRERRSQSIHAPISGCTVFFEQKDCAISVVIVGQRILDQRVEYRWRHPRIELHAVRTQFERLILA